MECLSILCKRSTPETEHTPNQLGPWQSLHCVLRGMEKREWCSHGDFYFLVQILPWYYPISSICPLCISYRLPLSGSKLAFLMALRRPEDYLFGSLYLDVSQRFPDIGPNSPHFTASLKGVLTPSQSPCALHVSCLKLECFPVYHWVSLFLSLCPVVLT